MHLIQQRIGIGACIPAGGYKIQNKITGPLRNLLTVNRRFVTLRDQVILIKAVDPVQQGRYKIVRSHWNNRIAVGHILSCFFLGLKLGFGVKDLLGCGNFLGAVGSLFDVILLGYQV
ncbi:hypothetical protein D3C73_688740 [compost metagenome]